MKKLLFVATIMVLSLTGCGMKEAEADEKITEVEAVCAQAIESAESLEEQCRELYFENTKYETILQIEETWEEEGLSEECKDEVIELINSIEHNPSYELGYDLDELQIQYVNILVKYDILPECCEGLTFNEIEELENEF